MKPFAPQAVPRGSKADQLFQHLTDLLEGFSQSAFTNLDITAALGPVVHAANAAFGARQTTVWLYDRQARELRIAATSAKGRRAAPHRQATEAAQAGRGLRLDRAQFLADGGEPVLVAPLRGARRALGTIVMQGRSVAKASETDAARFDGFARQLAVAIENVYLLDEVFRQRRLLEDTFNSLSDLVVVTDDALRVVQVNNAFAARVGLSGVDVMNRPVSEFIGRTMAAWVRSPAALRPAANDADAPGGFRHFDDERLGGRFAVSVAPLITRGGKPAGRVVVARDVTEQARLQAGQAALQERLAQSEKLASLGQFVAGIAHEMNNPLQAVLGHMELLLTTSEAARPLRRELRRIYSEGERAAKIVQDLLVFTGGRRKASQPVLLDAILSRALSSRRLARQGARIRVVRTRGHAMPAVIGDALLLYQAVLNVLINAEHAVSDVPAASRRIEVRTGIAGDGSTVQLTIKDSGRGIPPEVLPQIFDPFFTTRDVGQGSGLGLSIAYGIVQEHGGTIVVSNAAEGGAAFTIALPAVRADARV